MRTYIDEVTDLVKTKAGVQNKYLAQMYALLVLVKGEDITLSDVHDAWAMNMNFRVTTPVCYGHEHKSLVPFDQLSVETQNKDKRFVESLRAIAKSFKKKS